ncbi:MAG TPA: hypothetical protein VM734_19350 [Kofleriaceae bacterium]|nr:hypothetical protein [Kofleriaceae bacterium]
MSRSLVRVALAALIVIAAAACARPAPAPAPTATASLADVAWLAGDWAYDDGSGGEHWFATSTALVGVAFVGDDFEVLTIERDGGALRLVARPGGRPGVAFTHRPGTTPREARFENPVHDDPTSITYARPGDERVVATLDGPGGVRPFAMHAAPAPSVPALEELDRTTRGRDVRWSRVSATGALAATGGEHAGAGYVTIWRRAAGGNDWQLALDVAR